MQIPNELNYEQERHMHYILDEGISGLKQSRYFSIFIKLVLPISLTLNIKVIKVSH